MTIPFPEISSEVLRRSNFAVRSLRPDAMSRDKHRDGVSLFTAVARSMPRVRAWSYPDADLGRPHRRTRLTLPSLRRDARTHLAGAWTVVEWRAHAEVSRNRDNGRFGGAVNEALLMKLPERASADDAESCSCRAKATPVKYPCSPRMLHRPAWILTAAAIRTSDAGNGTFMSI